MIQSEKFVKQAAKRLQLDHLHKIQVSTLVNNSVTSKPSATITVLVELTKESRFTNRQRELKFRNRKPKSTKSNPRGYSGLLLTGSQPRAIRLVPAQTPMLTYLTVFASIQFLKPVIARGTIFCNLQSLQ